MSPAGPEAPPAPPPARTPRPTVPVRSTVASAFRLVVRQPRDSMLPLAVVQIPVAVVAAIATAVLFLTVFKDEPVDTTEGGPLLAFLLIGAGQLLFSQVSQAATIVSVAAAATGKPKTLSESLDPAFTRMGAILSLLAILLAGAAVGLFSLIGIILLPYLALRVMLCYQAMMLEGIGPWAAVRRSWNVTRGQMLHLLGLIVLLIGILAGPLILLESLTLISGNGHTTDALTVAGVTLAQGVLAIPLVSFLTATTTLFYLQVRAIANARPAA